MQEPYRKGRANYLGPSLALRVVRPWATGSKREGGHKKGHNSFLLQGEKVAVRPNRLIRRKNPLVTSFVSRGNGVRVNFGRFPDEKSGSQNENHSETLIRPQPTVSC